MMSHQEQYAVGERHVTLETGGVAGNANGAVWVSCDETVLLATATADMAKTIAPDAPLSLTVHYQEKLYATGRIPASFTKRQGKRSDNETLIARATDRCLRPLLPPALPYPIDLIIEVMSINPAMGGSPGSGVVDCATKIDSTTTNTSANPINSRITNILPNVAG